MSIATVIGPTPPGTGVMYPATSFALSKSTSPHSFLVPVLRFKITSRSVRNMLNKRISSGNLRRNIHRNISIVNSRKQRDLEQIRTGDGIYTAVDDDRAWLDPVALHELWAADANNENVCLSDDGRQIFGFRMANRNCSMIPFQQFRHWGADDFTATFK